MTNSRQDECNSSPPTKKFYNNTKINPRIQNNNDTFGSQKQKVYTHNQDIQNFNFNPNVSCNSLFNRKKVNLKDSNGFGVQFSFNNSNF